MHTYTNTNGLRIDYNSDFSGMATISYGGKEIEVPAIEVAVIVTEQQGSDDLARRIKAYHAALRGGDLSTELIHALVLDYHRAMFAPKRDDGYTIRFSRYEDYIDAYGRYELGMFRKGA